MTGYTQTAWNNNNPPAISADNLLKIERGINAALGFDSAEQIRGLGVPSTVFTVVLRGKQGGVFRWDATSNAAENGIGSPKSAGTIINPTGNSAAGRWVRADEIVYPSAFGALKTIDSTEAVNAYIAWAKSNKKPLYFNDHYVVSDSVNLTEFNNANINCVGAVIFERTNLSGSVVDLSFRHLTINGEWRVMFSSALNITSANTAAVGILLKGCARGDLGSIAIQHVHTGIKQEQALGFNGASLSNYNVFFSVTIKRMDVYDWVDYAIRLTAYNGGNTGSLISNCYLNNFVDGQRKTCAGFLFLSTTSEMTFAQLNTEHAKTTSAPFWIGSDCDAVIINGLHTEGWEPQQSNNGFFDVGASVNLIVNAWVLSYSYFTNIVAALFRLREGDKIVLNGITTRNNTNSNSTLYKIIGNAITSSATIAVFSAANIDVFNNNQTNTNGINVYRNNDQSAPNIVILGDENATYLPASGADGYIFNAPISAIRSVFLSGTGAFNGDSITVSRTAKSTGAFNVEVKDASGVLATLQAGQQVTVRRIGGIYY